MEWFGLNKYGPSSPIKEFMRPDYEEPTVQRDLLEVYESSPKKGNFAEQISEIDVYIGQADGFPYKEYDRLIHMRDKGHFKPVGPKDMCRLPGCTSMEIGWFYNDPVLEEATWHQTINKYI